MESMKLTEMIKIYIRDFSRQIKKRIINGFKDLIIKFKKLFM